LWAVCDVAIVRSNGTSAPSSNLASRIKGLEGVYAAGPSPKTAEPKAAPTTTISPTSTWQPKKEAASAYDDLPMPEMPTAVEETPVVEPELPPSVEEPPPLPEPEPAAIAEMAAIVSSLGTSVAAEEDPDLPPYDLLYLSHILSHLFRAFQLKLF
jgi:hypothetical protein